MRGETGGVGQEVSSCHPVPIRTSPLWQPASHSIVDTEALGFDEAHRQGRGRYDLRERSQVEGGFLGGGRRPGLVREPPERLSPQHAVMPADLHCGGGERPRRNRLLQQ